MTTAVKLDEGVFENEDGAKFEESQCIAWWLGGDGKEVSSDHQMEVLSGESGLNVDGKGSLISKSSLLKEYCGLKEQLCCENSGKQSNEQTQMKKEESSFDEQVYQEEKKQSGLFLVKEQLLHYVNRKLN